MTREWKNQASSLMTRAGLKKFQQTVSEVILSIGGEDTAKELYGPVAKAWNETEPPEDVKRR